MGRRELSASWCAAASPLMPVLILLGLRFGFAAPTEIAVLTVSTRWCSARSSTAT